MSKVNKYLTTKEFCMFRLNESFFCEDFKESFYKRNDNKNRTQIDSSKSDKLPPTYWELVSKNTTQRVGFLFLILVKSVVVL